MTQLPVNEPVETRLEEPRGALEELGKSNSPDDVARVAARFPACLAAWATLGEIALDAGRNTDAYAYFRTGYHRGLDRLRAAGWRGAGRVPWAHEPNRGFLRSVRGLGRAAEGIGETDEATRCAGFLGDLAPDAPRD